ncbi:MAG: OB-fold nucleic acid binding domain-containing protein [Candidatus Nanoarchaeia archaeon]
MQVKDLKPRQGNVNIELEIVDIGETREFQKFGNTGRVANAIGKDSTGQIKVSLWNDDVDKVKVGDRIKITNGYVSEFQGEKQLSAGRMGKLEVISKGESKDTEEEVEDSDEE